MLERRNTSYILLAVNMALIIFIIIRAGSADPEILTRTSASLQIRVLESPPPATPDTLVLNDFEKINDRMNMYDQGGEFSLSLSDRHVTRGKSSLLIERDPQSNIEMATVHFPRQWQYYDSLQVDVFNHSQSEETLWIRIGSQFDARRFYVRSQKYSKAFPLSPGENTVSIPVADITAAFGRLPYRKSLHFNFPPGKGAKFNFDCLRLIRHDGSDK